MEMKVFMSDKVGPGDETTASKKIARKSTTAARIAEPNYGTDDDSLSIEIYEVVDDIQDHLKVAGLTDPGQNPNNGLGNSYVIGDEILLSLNTKDPLNRTPQEKFLDLTRMIEAEKGQKKIYYPFLNKKPAPETTYATIPANKMIIREAPRPSMENTNAGVGVAKQSGVTNVEDCGYRNFRRNEEIVTGTCLPPKNKDGNDKGNGKEKTAVGVSSMGKVPAGGAAGGKIDGVIKATGGGAGTKSGSSAPQENKEKNTGDKRQKDQQDKPDRAPDKAPHEVPKKGPGGVSIEVKNEALEGIVGTRALQNEEVDLVNEVEEVMVSSGFAWTKDDQPRTEHYNTSGSTVRGGDLIGELKNNESGSSELVKKIKGIAVAEYGTAVEFREGRLVEKRGVEDKLPTQDEGIAPVAGESVISEDVNKRKRIQNGEETEKSHPKKRKVEKSKKSDANGFGDGKGKRKSQGSKKDSAKSGSSICNQSTLEETIDRVASGHLSLPFLENLRGEIKSLTRADLEELIVQKICEAITERSEIGHLRKRAEALEKNQERWREKVMSLTKQIKEMDMVMKNYMSEVRKHHTEKSYQMIAPLRVTRSVGLQVSFTETPSAKTMPKCYGNASQVREKAGKHSQSSVQVSEPPNKTIPILPTTPSNQPLVIDSSSPFSTKSGLTITLQPAGSSSDAQYAPKPIPIQQPKLSILPATDMPRMSFVDLTGEDERYLADKRPRTTQKTLTVGPPGQVKVVNHIQPAQNSVGAVTLLISNAANTPCCATTGGTNSEGQNRQMAVPGSSTQPTQRHILPAIPTLLYNPGTLVQPGSQVMAGQARAAAAKHAKHPAPLPLPPANQPHNPNWKLLPPMPTLRISKGETGIVLSWNMPLGPEYETIVSYQLFAYQESDSPPSSNLWKRVGDIKALRLPMACTVTHCVPGQNYHFSVRAVDVHSRVGPFSPPGSTATLQ